MTELSEILTATCAIACGAGAILKDGYSSGRTALQFKSSAIDPVTAYDLASERFIVDELTRHFPQHRLIGEEGGAYHANPDAAEVWYIDPLDGTVNFSHGLPWFCVSLGLWIRGVPTLGVIYNPATDELFSAARGLGAWRNGQPIRVATTSELDRALLITGFSYDTHHSDSNMQNFLAFQRSAQATRRIGSVALNLCYTATGQIDGHWEMKVQPHDMAAGIVLVQEAGGRVTDFAGGEAWLDSGQIVAANPALHPALLAVLQSTGDC